MTSEPASIDLTQRTAARVAGVMYPVAFACVVYANFAIRAPMFVNGDMAETMRRMVAGESSFRLSLTLDVIYCIGVTVVAAAFYVVLGPVNRFIALTAAV